MRHNEPRSLWSEHPSLVRTPTTSPAHQKHTVFIYSYINSIISYHNVIQWLLELNRGALSIADQLIGIGCHGAYDSYKEERRSDATREKKKKKDAVDTVPERADPSSDFLVLSRDWSICLNSEFTDEK